MEALATNAVRKAGHSPNREVQRFVRFVRFFSRAVLRRETVPLGTVRSVGNYNKMSISLGGGDLCDYLKPTTRRDTAAPARARPSTRRTSPERNRTEALGYDPGK